MEDFRTKASLFRAQFMTMTALRKKGFFIQYDHAGSVPMALSPYPEVEALFAEAEPEADGVLEKMAGYRRVFMDPVAGARFDWKSDMFSPFDSMVAYTMVCSTAPKKILEIGSGASTHVLAHALADSDGNGRVTCIDPAPRRDISALDVDLRQRVLSQEDVAMVDDFDAGDILFIDSSHIMLPGMDVDIEFNRMFPRLKPGVLVHVHDIFLPDNYPLDWRSRWYSEQNALIGWLLSGYFEVVFPSYFAVTRLADKVNRAAGDFPPFQRDGTAGSLWLRRAG